MKIMYYEVHDCEHKLINGSHAIIAPKGIDEKLLRKYDFVQLLDGRWIHFMTADEKLYMKNNKGKETLIFCNIEETFKRISKQERHQERVHAIVIISILLTIQLIIILLIQVRIETKRIDRENYKKEVCDTCYGILEMGSQFLDIMR